MKEISGKYTMIVLPELAGTRPRQRNLEKKVNAWLKAKSYYPARFDVDGEYHTQIALLPKKSKTFDWHDRRELDALIDELLI